MAVAVRQADRGRAPRLASRGRLRRRHHPARPLPPEGRRSRTAKGSSSPPTRRCAPRRATATARGWNRSSSGSPAATPRSSGTASTASSSWTKRTRWPTRPAASGARGDIAPSQQGLAGMRLQNALPDARVLYVSATGASTIQGLGYAVRLGLWATDRTPFEKREKFVHGDGGRRRRRARGRRPRPEGAGPVSGPRAQLHRRRDRHPRAPHHAGATRDLRRVRRRLQDHPRQPRRRPRGRRHHQPRRDAQPAGQGSGEKRLRERQAALLRPPAHLDEVPHADPRRSRKTWKKAARPSSSWSRPARRSPTGGLAEIPPAEWDDLSVDVTPREYVLDFLRHAFPTTLHEEYDGRRRERPLAPGPRQGRQPGAVGRGRPDPRRPDPQARPAAPGRLRPGPDRAALRRRGGGRDHRPLAADRQGARRARRAPRPAPAGRPRPTRTRRTPS